MRQEGGEGREGGEGGEGGREGGRGALNETRGIPQQYTY